MSHAIKIGKLIHSALLSDNDIYSVVNNRVFPLRVDEGTQYPFIFYTRVNLYPETGDKDGWYDDTVQFQISVESDDYDESCDIADLVRDLFENNVMSNSELQLYNIHVMSVSEEFGNDDYIQTIIFECSCENL